mmetsp:Transcript_22688/g.63010  ORF Transcript_22688/g.63010 Transcript_22688/m.63010 type:complete len:370 (+) Transcript_22688:824-1933(+)
MLGRSHWHCEARDAQGDWVAVADFVKLAGLLGGAGADVHIGPRRCIALKVGELGLHGGARVGRDGVLRPLCTLIIAGTVAGWILVILYLRWPVATLDLWRACFHAPPLLWPRLAVFLGGHGGLCHWTAGLCHWNVRVNYRLWGGRRNLIKGGGLWNSSGRRPAEGRLPVPQIGLLNQANAAENGANVVQPALDCDKCLSAALSILADKLGGNFYKGNRLHPCQQEADKAACELPQGEGSLLGRVLLGVVVAAREALPHTDSRKAQRLLLQQAAEQLWEMALPVPGIRQLPGAGDDLHSLQDVDDIVQTPPGHVEFLCRCVEPDLGGVLVCGIATVHFLETLAQEHQFALARRMGGRDLLAALAASQDRC